MSTYTNSSDGQKTYVDKRVASIMEQLKKYAYPCIQCGTCSGSCPNADFMAAPPRHMWRQVLTGDIDGIFDGASFALCSTCYTCTLRCPMGLPLTEMMGALKRLAYLKNSPVYQKSRRFYGSFMDSVRKYGRVNEAEFMTRFFILEKNPALPLKYAPLGIRLMASGKVGLGLPFPKNNGVLGPVFKKAAEMEEKR